MSENYTTFAPAKVFCRWDRQRKKAVTYCLKAFTRLFSDYLKRRNFQKTTQRQDDVDAHGCINSLLPVMGTICVYIHDAGNCSVF